MFLEIIVPIEIVIYIGYKIHSLGCKYYRERITPEKAFSMLGSLLQNVVEKDVIPTEFLVKFGEYNSNLFLETFYSLDFAKLPADLYYFKYREISSVPKDTDYTSFAAGFNNHNAYRQINNYDGPFESSEIIICIEEMGRMIPEIMVAASANLLVYLSANYIYFNLFLLDPADYIFSAIEKNDTKIKDSFFMFYSLERDITNQDGDNLFTFATKRKDYQTIWKLMDKSIELEKNLNNQTALDIAKETNNSKMSELLSKYQQNLADYNKCVKFTELVAKIHSNHNDISGLTNMVGQNSSLIYKVESTESKFKLECLNSDRNQLLVELRLYPNNIPERKIITLLDESPNKIELPLNYASSGHVYSKALRSIKGSTIDSVEYYSPRPIGEDIDYYLTDYS